MLDALPVCVRASGAHAASDAGDVWGAGSAPYCHAMRLSDAANQLPTVCHTRSHAKTFVRHSCQRGLLCCCQSTRGVPTNPDLPGVPPYLVLQPVAGDAVLHVGLEDPDRLPGNHPAGSSGRGARQCCVRRLLAATVTYGAAVSWDPCSRPTALYPHAHLQPNVPASRLYQPNPAPTSSTKPSACPLCCCCCCSEPGCPAPPFCC